MSMYDWNGDGKKGFTDNFIEYNIYKNSTSNGGNNRSKPPKGDISTLGVIGCVIGGLAITGLLFSQADLDSIPKIVIGIIWVAISIGLAAIVCAVKK